MPDIRLLILIYSQLETRITEKVAENTFQQPPSSTELTTRVFNLFPVQLYKSWALSVSAAVRCVDHQKPPSRRAPGLLLQVRRG